MKENTYREIVFEDSELLDVTVEFAERVRSLGGRALVVGGAVRDAVLGLDPKDFDIEVYGLEPAVVKLAAEQTGRVDEAGAAFTVLKVTRGNADIDVSLPRRDSSTGRGHKDFTIQADPQMSIEDAARRRDFTFNALASDPLTGEVFDYYGGAEALNNSIIEVTDDELFKDDPLRVMRAVQFAGRFGMTASSNTEKIMKGMVPELEHLSGERMGEEWRKLLVKSPYPSNGLELAESLGVIDEYYPELASLKGVQQEYEWHPEGDVWVHTLQVVDQAAQIARREKMTDEQTHIAVLAALCHDLGKATTTEYTNDRWRAHKHDQAGAEPAKQFMARINTPKKIVDKVIPLVKEHLRPAEFYTKRDSIKVGSIRRLSARISPATMLDLVTVAEADHTGRQPEETYQQPDLDVVNERNYKPGEWLLGIAKALQVDKKPAPPLITGKDLLALGMKPGPSMGNVIKLADELRDEAGYDRSTVLELVSASVTTDQHSVELTLSQALVIVKR